jgi:uncharacterized membrane protein YkvI
MTTKNNRLSVGFGIAFIWFTTQFGGGFASGAQLKSYFIDYGIYCIITCIGAQAICAIYNAYISYYCRRHKTYDYRSFNDSFYGKYSPIFSNLYEIVYIAVLLIVPAVAFSTGGTTLSRLTGLPYFLSTLLIGVFIFVVAIYGTEIVRKVATILSILIVGGLLLVFIPNIIVQWDSITASMSHISDLSLPIWPAIWSMIVYAAFQLAAAPAIFSQHSEALIDEKDSKFTFLIGFLVNSVMISLSTFGLLAIVQTSGYAESKLPVMLLVENGVGGAILTPIISILIILGSVSTAVNMVAAGSSRICKVIDKEPNTTGKPSKNTIISILVLCLLGFGVAQFGLLALIAKGYGTLAYLTFPVIIIPYVVHMIYTKFDTKSDANIDTNINA